MNIGLLSLAIAVGQPAALPAGAEGPPIIPAAPFLIVSVTAPGESKITWQPMTSEATVTNGPVGLRPGYIHRFQVSDIPDAKQAVLYPSIEVRGTLIPRGPLDITKHPVPITLTEHDIDQVLDGRLVTKVYYIEDPDQAVPVQGRPGEALEATALTEEDAIKEARLRGRPMLIVRVGERPFTKEELARENVAGTVLYPNSRTVPVPAAPPIFPFACVPLFDPIHGPRAATEECLRNGCDYGPLLGEGPGRSIGGLNPADTAMMFSTRFGTKVFPSNRVCICVPRFAASRVDVGPLRHHTIHAPHAHHMLKPTAALDVRTPSGVITGGEHLAGIIGSLRASGIQSHVGPVTLVDLRGRALGLSSVRGVAVVAQARGPEEITVYRGCAMLLEKSIDPPHPEKIGDVLTVTLKFTNPTTETMTDIVIADNLTPRLEYIEGSTKSDRATTFTSVPNGAGSLVLRWAVDGKLMPGESGKITFQVRIR